MSVCDSENSQNTVLLMLNFRANYCSNKGLIGSENKSRKLWITPCKAIFCVLIYQPFDNKKHP